MEPVVLRDVCRMLGGLLLEGARRDLLEEVVAREPARTLGTRLGAAMAGPLDAMQAAIEAEGVQATAVEYTRLTVADATAGARKPVPVPLWEEVYLGSDRRVAGERTRAVLKKYVEAGLGFDRIKEQPADTIGLELLFVAALLDQEAAGTRDASARKAFVAEHLGPFARALGNVLATASKTAFWREAGRALVLLPELVG
jgi:TorA maturation chaperone TorD